MSAEEKEITDSIATILREEGYRAKIIGDDRIITGAGGFKLFIIVYTTSSIQMASYFTNFKENRVTSENANNFHEKYRFSKLVVDDSDDSLSVQADFWFDKDSASASESLSWAMSRFERSLREFRDFVFDGRDEDATAEPSSQDDE